MRPDDLVFIPNKINEVKDWHVHNGRTASYHELAFRLAAERAALRLERFDFESPDITGTELTTDQRLQHPFQDEVANMVEVRYSNDGP